VRLSIRGGAELVVELLFPTFMLQAGTHEHVSPVDLCEGHGVVKRARISAGPEQDSGEHALAADLVDQGDAFPNGRRYAPSRFQSQREPGRTIRALTSGMFASLAQAKTA